MNITARHVPLLRLPVLCACLALTFAAGSLQADNAVHPVKMSKEQIAGRIFEDHEPVVSTHNGNTTHDVEVFRTSVRSSEGLDRWTEWLRQRWTAKCRSAGD